MPLLDELSKKSFTPEQLVNIRAAFGAVLREIGLIERDDPLVRLVAKTIVEVASAGDLSSNGIRSRALKRLTYFEAEDAATRCLLRDAIAMAGADLGNIQCYDPADRSLAIVALDDGSACARAMRAKSPMFIPVVALDPDFAPYKAVAERAGFASVLSMPLITHSTQFVGVLSVHFTRSRAADYTRMDLLSDYARHAANALAGISGRVIRMPD